MAANVTLQSLSWTIFGFAWKPANPLRSRLPAVNGHVDAFAVTADAFVGACFPSLLGWCRPHDPHFLRAFCTEQRPRVSVDDLVLQMMLYGHDDFPPAQGKRTMGITLAPMAEWRLYKMAHLHAAVVEVLGRVRGTRRRVGVGVKQKGALRLPYARTTGADCSNPAWSSE